MLGLTLHSRGTARKRAAPQFERSASLPSRCSRQCQSASHNRSRAQNVSSATRRPCGCTQCSGNACRPCRCRTIAARAAKRGLCSSPACGNVPAIPSRQPVRLSGHPASRQCVSSRSIRCRCRRTRQSTRTRR